MDWDGIVTKLEQHFSTCSNQHTISGRQVAGFQVLEPRSTRVTYVDGGNAALFVAPSVCVQLVRVAAVEYAAGKRIGTHRAEALCTVAREGEIFRISWAGQPWEELELSLLDALSVEAAADIARRVAERTFAGKFRSLVVFDGDLACKHVAEEAALASLTMPLCGLAKTTTMLTDQGLSVPGVLHGLGLPEPWLYCLNEHKGIVKLHRLAKTAFKLEVKGVHLQEAASAMMATNDPSFPGYPYGLVEADRLARVGAREQAGLAEMLRTRLGGRYAGYTGSLDAHSILDTIAGDSSY